MSTDGQFRRFRGLVLALLVLYVVALAVLVLGPWGWGLNRITVQLYTQFLYDWPIAPHWALPEHYGVLLNVLLFVPLGAGVAILSGRPWWWVTLVAAALSGAIEVVQGLWLARESLWSDVAANTTGALLGALIVSLLARVQWRAGSRSECVRRR